MVLVCEYSCDLQCCKRGVMNVDLDFIIKLKNF